MRGMRSAACAVLALTAIVTPLRAQDAPLAGRVLDHGGQVFNVAHPAFGAIADRADANNTEPHNNPRIVSAMRAAATAGGGVVLVPPGVRWDYLNDRGGGMPRDQQPPDVVVLDLSGWDWSAPRHRFSAIQQTIFRTLDPGGENANEYRIVSDWHPALVLDVIDGDSAARNEERIASVVYRENGAGRWVHGLYPGTGGEFPGSFRLFRILPDGTMQPSLVIHPDGRIAFNWGSPPPPSGDYTYRSADRTADRVVTMWAPGEDVAFREDVTSAGAREIRSDGALTGYYTDDFVFSGQKFEARAPAEMHRIEGAPGFSESGSTYSDRAATSRLTVTLPPATPGQQYRFVVTRATGLAVAVTAGERFRSGDRTLSATDPGAVLEVFCVSPGVWDRVAHGDWR